jgi:hypothetical protein
MLLSTRNITLGDTRRYVVDYRDFLDKGVKLATVAVTTNGPTSTVQNASISEDETEVYFYATAGVLNEVFTVNLQVTDTNLETVNDTLDFTVVAP